MGYRVFRQQPLRYALLAKPQGSKGAGKDIAQHNKEASNTWLCRNDDEKHDDDNQHIELHFLKPLCMLKAIILDRAHHQKGQSIDHDQDRHVFGGSRPAKTIE